MARKIEMEIRPFGRVTIEIYPALVDDELRIYAQVQDNPFVPLVSAGTQDAREFAQMILEAVAAAEHAQGEITSKAEAQRRAGLRTQPKPGEPGFQEPK